MARRPTSAAGSGAARETIVSARGLNVFVRERGGGHPLVMLNGIGANADMWGAAEQILASRSRTIAVDCPGTGRSQTPPFPLPMRALAELVVDLLDRLGYDEVDVLGFSFGGALAQQLARDAPGRVRRLALVSTGCGWGGSVGSLPALAAVALPLPYYSRGWHELTSRFLGEPAASADAVHARLRGRPRHPPTGLGYAYQLAALAPWSSLPWLRTVQAPTLVVAGALDRLIPAANGVQLARLLPNGRLQLVPGGAHMLFDGDGPAPLLLADFFGAASLDDSTAWTTGLAATGG